MRRNPGKGWRLLSGRIRMRRPHSVTPAGRRIGVSVTGRGAHAFMPLLSDVASHPSCPRLGLPASMGRGCRVDASALARKKQDVVCLSTLEVAHRMRRATTVGAITVNGFPRRRWARLWPVLPPP